MSAPGLSWGDVKEDTPLASLSAAAASFTPGAATAAAPVASPPAAAAAAAAAPSASPTFSPSPDGSASSSSSGAAPGGASVDAVAGDLQKAQVTADAEKGDDDEVQIAAFTGLHPNDRTAQVSVTMGADDSAASGAALAGAPAPATIYKAVATFDELGLSKELLSGVYAMKFTAPSKIQAQALPIIMAPKSDRQTV